MIPSYKTHDPRGWCGDPKRGAALGRTTWRGEPDFDGKLVLRRIHLNSGGYDCNGTYFGTPDNLYWYASEDGTIDGVLRAESRRDAFVEVQKLYPKAKFYRGERNVIILDAFTRSYLKTALWSSTDNASEDGGEPLDKNYSLADFAPSCVRALAAECEAFQVTHHALLAPFDLSTAGHDLWLTRNGHGAGYWDGDYPEPAATRLTEAAKALGEVDLYVGDDGQIWASGYEDGKPQEMSANG